MRWQIILPIILAAFFVSCSKNVANASFDNYAKTSVIANKEEQNIVNKILRESRAWINTPYVLGGNSNIKGADCSAFTQSIFKKAFNINISRVTTGQIKNGKRVARSKLKAGDLIFFRGKGPNNLHVGIYLSNDNFIHLSASGGAKIKELSLKYWNDRYLTAKRYDGVR